MLNRSADSGTPAAVKVALVVALALVVGLWAFVFARSDDAAAGLTAEDTAASQPFGERRAPVVRNTLAEGLEGLGKDEPYAVAVLGDSTGTGEGNWPREIAEWMGETYDRPVTFHSWREYSNEVIRSEGLKPGYVDQEVVTEGSGAPIAFYNGSAPARDSEYSLKKLDELIPVKPSDVDLVFVSHGHNEGPGEVLPGVGDLVFTQAPVYDATTWVVVLQNPEKPNTPHAAIQEAGTDSLRGTFEAERFPTVDVEAAFEEIPRFWTLYEDNLHLDPAQEEGSRIWVDAVLDVLKPAAPAPRVAS